MRCSELKKSKEVTTLKTQKVSTMEEVKVVFFFLIENEVDKNDLRITRCLYCLCSVQSSAVSMSSSASNSVIVNHSSASN